MKALTQSEFSRILSELDSWRGAHLQELEATSTSLGLGWYMRGRVHWLWFDLSPACPLVLHLEERPGAKSKKLTPVLLFLRSHARGRALTQVQSVAGAGRTGRLIIGPEGSSCTLEFRLFPHGQNLFIHAGNRNISWHKVKELGEGPTSSVEAVGRSWDEISQAWLQARRQPSTRPRDLQQLQREVEQRLQRKHRAVAEVREALVQHHPWSEVGEHLKVYGYQNLPSEWQTLVDARAPLAEQIQLCFHKAKQHAHKLAGHHKRLQQLEQELANLQTLVTTADAEQLEKALRPTRSVLPQKLAGTVKMRSYTSARGFVLQVGKSARDNLALLRAARSWDLWLHLRDYPGAHGIIRREREQNPSAADLEEMARWLVTHTLSRATQRGRFAVVVVESRYVRPIKGDQLGRVHYSHERVISVTLE